MTVSVGTWDTDDFNPRSPCGERRPPAPGDFAWTEYFNPRSPCGERRSPTRTPLALSLFQSTLPVWGATGPVGPVSPFGPISIHAPRVGSDGTLVERGGRPMAFQSTLPVWGATCLPRSYTQGKSKFQSTLPVWGATGRDTGSLGASPISIHAPRVGSDEARTAAQQVYDVFQSTLPVWGATRDCRPYQQCQQFQSTLPVWGATGGVRVGAGARVFQSTLPVWGATPTRPGPTPGEPISIHAPRVGSDSSSRPPECPGRYFNPRSPCGERQPPFSVGGQLQAISIHAPRVGSDLRRRDTCRSGEHFNPRSPCGERQFVGSELLFASEFQSTLPVWGATRGRGRITEGAGVFQSTLPVWGATAPRRLSRPKAAYFNPRSPCGERLIASLQSSQIRHFNPRSPCGERQQNCTNTS